MLKILAIGNSFSQDAARYLWQTAHADGFDLKVVNLYIGGCPLFRHFINISRDSRDYELEFNGMNTRFNVSVKEALLSEEWDIVTLQQVSSLSDKYDTYQPYLNTLAEYVRKYAPKARLYMHQTWAYKENSAGLNERMGYKNHLEMFEAVKPCYKRAAADINADGIIPSGEAMANLYKLGVPVFHRDDIHASLGLGRYTLALTWYEYLTGNSVSDNSFCDFDEEISAADIEKAKKAAHSAAADIAL